MKCKETISAYINRIFSEMGAEAKAMMEEMVADYNEQLLDGEEPMTLAELKGVMRIDN